MEGDLHIKRFLEYKEDAPDLWGGVTSINPTARVTIRDCVSPLLTLCKSRKFFFFFPNFMEKSPLAGHNELKFVGSHDLEKKKSTCDHSYNCRDLYFKFQRSYIVACEQFSESMQGSAACCVRVVGTELPRLFFFLQICLISRSSRRPARAISAVIPLPCCVTRQKWLTDCICHFVQNLIVAINGTKAFKSLYEITFSSPVTSI